MKFDNPISSMEYAFMFSERTSKFLEKKKKKHEKGREQPSLLAVGQITLAVRELQKEPLGVYKGLFAAQMSNYEM